MRIVTRPDFDGIVCAVLLRTAENIHTDIHWVEPSEIQSGKAAIIPGDILANLPYSSQCALWFDHHISNKPEDPFNGAFDIAPSAAGVVYKYYQQNGKIAHQYDELINHTDIIDAAKLDKHQVQFPQEYPYILLSMTIQNNGYEDIPYWNHLVNLLMKTKIDMILEDPDVKVRCDQVIKENAEYEAHLRQHTKMDHNISITDFRILDIVPQGNRFLSYSLFPESIASVKIRFGGTKKESVQISIGRSIFNTRCQVNIGKLLAQFGGGGHAGAGGCTLDAKTADADIKKILEIMFANKKAE
ncbi:MAG: exopolyphosphatase [Desulfobacula sp.]|nr:exopolyphosphatase [Desulfobacula sp.]